MSWHSLIALSHVAFEDGTTYNIDMILLSCAYRTSFWMSVCQHRSQAHDQHLHPTQSNAYTHRKTGDVSVSTSDVADLTAPLEQHNGRYLPTSGRAISHRRMRSGYR